MDDSYSGAVFTPQALLDLLKVSVSYEEIIDGVGIQRDTSRKRGTTAYRSGIYHDNLDGVVDIVAEWLNKESQIIDESGEWLTIQCPWSDGHTDSENKAGYKPLGRGNKPDQRGFHCFHDHCKSKRIKDYLAKLDEDHEHFPEDIYAYDPAAELLRDYIYVAKASGYDSGCVVNIDTAAVVTRWQPGATCSSSTRPISRSSARSCTATAPRVSSSSAWSSISML